MLSHFPRPAQDNGRGVHWSPSQYFWGKEDWGFWKEQLQAMNIKWVKMLDDGGGSAMGLVKRLIENARKADTEHDFGKNIIPSMLKHDRVFAYPHVDADTGKSAYWKDVGTIEAYYEANFDLITETPGIDLYDKAWPIYTFEKQAPPARITGFEEREGTFYGMVSNSMLSKGCRIHGAHIENSILSPNVTVGQYSIVKDSVVLDNVRIGRDCIIQNAIIDKEVVIPDGTEIGCNSKRDARTFTVSESGVVVIARGSTL